MAGIEIKNLSNSYIEATKEFINSILYGEFGFKPNKELDDDIFNLEDSYRPPNGTFLLILKDKEIIGTAGLRKLSEESAELKRMFIKEEYRGQGLGATLLRKLIDFAKKQNYKKIFLDSDRSLKAAKTLYTKFGFVETERYNNNFRADIFMVKKL